MASKVVLLPGCDHAVQQELPAEVNAERSTSCDATTGAENPTPCSGGLDLCRGSQHPGYMTKGTDISCPASIFRTMRPKSPVARLQTRLERSTREVKH
jgi:hypothetical protein